MTIPNTPSADAEPLLPDRATLDFDPGLVRRFAATATTVLQSHTNNTDAEQILHRLCDDAMSSIEAAGASVLLVDSAANRLYRVASVGWVAENNLTEQELSIDDDSSWFTVALRAGPPLFIEDITSWQTPSVIRQTAISAGIKTCWVARLSTADSEPLGTFSVSWTNVHSATAGQCWAFEEFATLAQMIVELHQEQWHRMAMIAQERNRIAGELHDDSVQAMTAVSLRLQRLTGRVGSEHASAVADARTEVDQSIERLRHMMFSLHSDTLAEEGLVVSLAIYLETYIEPYGISTEIDGDEHTRLPPEVEALAFRLARGALVNVTKHAEATSVRVHVTATPRTVEAHIHDNGVGFDPAAATLIDQPGHFGIAYAKSLAASVGGTYTIDSAPGAGTNVAFRLPIL